MLHSDYPDQACSIARTLEVVGERWTLLIVREVTLGTSRFDDLVDHLGITRTVLSHRLDVLVREGVLERTAYQERPVRHAYVLTDKGRDLGPVLAAMISWGDTYYPHPDGPPRLLLHADCWGTVTQVLTCGRCGDHVTGDRVAAVPGPALHGRAHERIAL